MGRLLALDVGRKRTGIAVTDILQIVPGGLGFQPTYQVAAWVREYCTSEPVDAIIVGQPKQVDNTPSESMKYIVPVVNRLRKLLPGMSIIPYDERFTTVMAERAMIVGGVPKMKRREKGLADEISAVIILRDFMESRAYEEYKLSKS
ncbi:MAG: Holliday junction resolvase RuvX [Porphyromonas sp.]|nr:Holliday junction resolvase RuvX [Porphyromonas sp.]